MGKWFRLDGSGIVRGIFLLLSLFVFEMNDGWLFYGTLLSYPISPPHQNGHLILFHVDNSVNRLHFAENGGKSMKRNVMHQR